jgi:hypothetical protein
MNREKIISKLKNRLDFLNRTLVNKNDLKLVKEFLDIEKEIQIQSMYLKMENK